MKREITLKTYEYEDEHYLLADDDKASYPPERVHLWKFECSRLSAGDKLAALAELNARRDLYLPGGQIGNATAYNIAASIEVIGRVLKDWSLPSDYSALKYDRENKKVIGELPEVVLYALASQIQYGRALSAEEALKRTQKIEDQKKTD